MEKVRIEAGPADQIEFTGELVAELEWSLRNLAFSAHAKAYRTDTSKLVVSVDEWEDEASEPQPHKVRYAIVPLAALETARHRGRLARFFRGDVLSTLRNGMADAFPVFAGDRPAVMAQLVADKLGYGPAVLRQV